MRFVRLGLLFFLAGCQSVGVVPGPGGGSHATVAGVPDAGGHLYVAVASSTHYPSVERFRLVNGLPEEYPDRVLKGYGGLIAVSANGTLYAFGSSPGSVIYAFGPRGKKPLRTIEIPNPGRCGVSSGEVTDVSALASDANGYLFVGIVTYAEVAEHSAGRTASAPAAGSVPCDGVAIFAPDASGKARPVQTITFRHRAVVPGLAVDDSDNLYVSDFQKRVIEFANAVDSPAKVRVFESKYVTRVSSIAVDGAGDVFIGNSEYGYKDGAIDRYAPDASGDGPPTSQILLQGSGLHYVRFMAVRKRVLYLVDGFDRLDLYRARKDGGQSPFDSISTPNVTSIAVGP